MLWSNSAENLNLVEQIVRKLLMKDIVISKLPKPSESVGESVYAHSLIHTHSHSCRRVHARTLVFVGAFTRAHLFA